MQLSSTTPLGGAVPFWQSRIGAACILLTVGFVVAFAPVINKLAHTVWNTDEQGHGPIILAVVAWLLWLRRGALRAAAEEGRPGGAGGWTVLVFGLAIYVFGRLQNLVPFEMGALLLLLTGALAVTFGWRVVRVAAFPIFFLLFAVPLPGPLVDMLTQPLKQAVSWASEQVLYAFGYPIARTGVILMVGQYQLLVADACAGLNSMFTLEALGLLYMNVVGHTNRARNVALAILIIPMSFCANVVRVMILVLVTYHFGDAAGQGFVHNAAGMVLFLVALTLMFIMDAALGLVFDRKRRHMRETTT
jgi:exosortase B